jgi:hypothetical protein
MVASMAAPRVAWWVDCWVGSTAARWDLLMAVQRAALKGCWTADRKESKWAVSRAGLWVGESVDPMAVTKVAWKVVLMAVLKAEHSVE